MSYLLSWSLPGVAFKMAPYLLQSFPVTLSIMSHLMGTYGKCSSAPPTTTTMVKTSSSRLPRQFHKRQLNDNRQGLHLKLLFDIGSHASRNYVYGNLNENIRRTSSHIASLLKIQFVLYNIMDDTPLHCFWSRDYIISYY